jgi:hypothetical protein
VEAREAHEPLITQAPPNHGSSDRGAVVFVGPTLCGTSRSIIWVFQAVRDDGVAALNILRILGVLLDVICQRFTNSGGVRRVYGAVECADQSILAENSLVFGCDRVRVHWARWDWISRSGGHDGDAVTRSLGVGPGGQGGGHHVRLGLQGRFDGAFGSQLGLRVPM